MVARNSNKSRLRSKHSSSSKSDLSHVAGAQNQTSQTLHDSSNSHPSHAHRASSASALPDYVVNPLSIWARLWIGILIGFNILFMMGAIVSLFKKSAELSPLIGGIFIVLGVLDTLFLVLLLAKKRFAFYGTLIMSVLSFILNAQTGANLLVNALFALVPAIVTIALILPSWKELR